MEQSEINEKVTQLRTNGWIIIDNEEEAAQLTTALEADIKEGTVIGTRSGKQFIIMLKAFYDANVKAITALAAETPIRPSEGRIRLALFTDQYQRTFASVPLGTGGMANYPIRSKAFRGIAALQVMAQVDGRGNPKTPTSEHISTYLAECEAEAFRNNQHYDIYNRAARFDEDYYIDLADEAWRVVKFNRDGWQVLDVQPFPMFMRYNHMQPIDIDSQGKREAFDRFNDLLHVSSEYRIQIETYIILTGLAGIQHVILYMTGAQGSVKSTAQELAGSVFDPTITDTLTLPHQQRELVQQLMHHFIPVYDNVDGISDDIASDLCRACTGGGFEKRELYTNDDDIIYRYRRKVMLNGINLANHRPDFIERCLIIPQERVTNEQRKPKEEIAREAKLLLPTVRAYCLDMLVKAVAEYEGVAKELRGKLPRMADYCIWAECVGRALGYEPMAFYNSYMAQQNRQTLDALLSDTIGELTLAWLERNEDWQSKKEVEVTPTQFYNELMATAEERKYNLKQIRFPGSPTWMTNRLNNLKHSLAEYGIKVDTGIRGRDRNRYLFTTSSSTPSTPPQTRLQNEGGARHGGVEQSRLAPSPQTNDGNGSIGASGAISDNTSSVKSHEASAGSGVHLPDDGAGSQRSPSGTGILPPAPGQPTDNNPSHPEFIDGLCEYCGKAGRVYKDGSGRYTHVDCDPQRKRDDEIED